LRAADLRVFVEGRALDEVTFDSICPGKNPTESVVPTAPDGMPPFGVVFFFDEVHLSPEGRRRAYSLGGALGQALIPKGARLSIVVQRATRNILARDIGEPSEWERVIEAGAASTGGFFSTVPAAEGRFTSFTLEAMRLANEYTYECKVGRGAVEELRGAENRGTSCEERYRSRAEALLANARSAADEQHQLVRRSLEGLAEATLLLAASPSPRLVIYFGDLLVTNSGQPYARFLQNDERVRVLRNLAARNGASLDSDRYDAIREFERFTVAAATFGVRVDAISGRGLVATTSLSSAADSAIASLALNTGGRHFLGGASDEGIQQAILRDTSCRGQIGFDPTGLPLDRPLSFRVETPKGGPRLRVPPRIVIQSDRERIRARLLAATLGVSDGDASTEVLATVIPIGFANGEFEAMLQITARATTGDARRWDLGASILLDGRLIAAVQKGIEVPRPGIPVVLEHVVRFPPGGVSVEAVAHAIADDRIGRWTYRGDWEAPGAEGVSLTPIVMLQPGAGAIVRDGEARIGGSLAVESTNMVRADAPIAFVALLCGGGDGLGVEVKRSLEGDRRVEFETFPATFESDGVDCRQIRDVIPAGTLGDGAFRYTARVEAGGRVLAEGSTTLRVGAPLR
jgi:hypothetical protein